MNILKKILSKLSPGTSQVELLTEPDNKDAITGQPMHWYRFSILYPGHPAINGRIEAVNAETARHYAYTHLLGESTITAHTTKTKNQWKVNWRVGSKPAMVFTTTATRKEAAEDNARMGFLTNSKISIEIE